MAILWHYICHGCSEGVAEVLRDRMDVCFACCWCGELTVGNLLKAEDVPCEDTCVSEWFKPAKGIQ